MGEMRQEVELKLRSALLRDWCRQLANSNEEVEFSDAWCSGWRTLRFSTKTIEQIFDGEHGSEDCWGLGRSVFYEVSNEPDRVMLSLSVSAKGLNRSQNRCLDELAKALNCPSNDGKKSPFHLMEWSLSEGACSGNDAVAHLEEAWLSDVTFFERSLSAWLNGRHVELWRIPDSDRDVIASDELPDELFVEGAQVAILTDRFERNRAARRRCLAVHGAVCAICEMDFGSKYGAQFAGKIEVHHKVPLSEIREDYEVDPVNDLVPVCPNCHMVLHSKPGGGAYSVEEVKAMLSNASEGE